MPARNGFDRRQAQLILSDEEGIVQSVHAGMSPGWPSETLLTVTFAEHEGKTKLTLQQTVLESVAERHGAQQDWTGTLDRLAEYPART